MSETPRSPRLSAFDELRCAVSLNPPVDYLYGTAARVTFLAELGRICESAKRQCMPEHPRNVAYLDASTRSRARVRRLSECDDSLEAAKKKAAVLTFERREAQLRRAA